MADELVKVGIIAEDKTGPGVASAKRNLDSLGKGAQSAAGGLNTLKAAAIGASAKSLYFGNDVEDQNYYGQSRHENVRRLVWGPWQDLMKRMHTYFAKGAGVIPVVRYPIGTGADENGANDDNFKRARSIIDTLSGAAGVCFPFEATKQAIDADTPEARAEARFRKLQADDRLIGPAKLAYRYSIEPTYLIQGCAAALRFAQEGDPQAAAADAFELWDPTGLASIPLQWWDQNKYNEDVVRRPDFSSDGGGPEVARYKKRAIFAKGRK